MNDFKAAPECWEWQEKWASKEVPDEDSSCFLELRARVEALEAQADHSPGATKKVPVAKVTRDRDETGNYVIVHDTATPPLVAGGLVARVAYAITAITGDSDGPINWSPEARAAILEVAKWLREQGWKNAANLLEQEAGR
jgi:hypothetical protein